MAYGSRLLGSFTRAALEESARALISKDAAAYVAPDGDETMTEQELIAEVQPPESGFSMNWQMVDGYGASVQVTMRAALLTGWPDVLKARKAFVDAAMTHGWTILGRANTAPPERAHEPAPVQAAPVQAQPAPAAQTNGNGLTFQAETMTAEVIDGKARWKIKGGQFKKWGVSVYPEVLDAAGFASLNPLQPGGYNMAGWTAHYIENEGKAQKVVKLTK